jgi:hypothetical protein
MYMYLEDSLLITAHMSDIINLLYMKWNNIIALQNVI